MDHSVGSSLGVWDPRILTTHTAMRRLRQFHRPSGRDRLDQFERAWYRRSHNERCGSRFHGENPFTYDPRSYNFAREGEGYFFENAQNYEIRFRWIVDPLDGPEGVVATPRYNSYDFTCPRADGDCFFPEWDG